MSHGLVVLCSAIRHLPHVCRKPFVTYLMQSVILRCRQPIQPIECPSGRAREWRGWSREMNPAGQETRRLVHYAGKGQQQNQVGLAVPLFGQVAEEPLASSKVTTWYFGGGGTLGRHTSRLLLKQAHGENQAQPKRQVLLLATSGGLSILMSISAFQRSAGTWQRNKKEQTKRGLRNYEKKKQSDIYSRCPRFNQHSGM